MIVAKSDKAFVSLIVLIQSSWLISFDEDVKLCCFVQPTPIRLMDSWAGVRSDGVGEIVRKEEGNMEGRNRDKSERQAGKQQVTGGRITILSHFPECGSKQNSFIFILWLVFCNPIFLQADLLSLLPRRAVLSVP